MRHLRERRHAPCPETGKEEEEEEEEGGGGRCVQAQRTGAKVELTLQPRRSRDSSCFGDLNNETWVCRVTSGSSIQVARASRLYTTDPNNERADTSTRNTEPNYE